MSFVLRIFIIMKKLKCVFLLAPLALLMVTGCKEKELSKTISLDFSQQPVSIHETGLINDVQIVSLDCDEVLLGNINKIIRYNDRIYLTDYSRSRSVVIYDTLGRYVNTVSRYGQGPNEYIQLTDNFIDPADHSLHLISRMDKKMLKFNTDGQQLLEVKKLPKAFTQFSKTTEGFAGYMGNYTENANEPQNVWLLDNNLNIAHASFDIDPTWESQTTGNGAVFSAYKSRIYYTQPMDPNIYAIEKENVSTPYTFDLGKTAWPDEYKTYGQYDRLRSEFRHSDYIFKFYNFQETRDHLIIHSVYKGQHLLGIYNKQNAQSYVATLEANTDKYFFPFGRIIGIDEQAIYTLVDAEDIKRMWTGKDQYNDYESMYPEQIKRLREKFPHVREDGNPFLVIYAVH